MTGQDIQDRLDAIVFDLQTRGKGQTVQIVLRDGDNNPQTFMLSSDASGVVNAAQLGAIQGFLDFIKPTADAYETHLAPVTAASESYRAARAAHQPLIEAYTAARDAMNDAFLADANLQAARTALETAQNAPAYITARTLYKSSNVSENYGNLQDAKGKYLVA